MRFGSLLAAALLSLPDEASCWSTFTSRKSASSIRRQAKSNGKDDDSLNFGLGGSPNEEPRLGIDIGSMLEPLSEREANELKAAAAEVINDAIAEGLDEIDTVRNRMKVEFEKKRQSMALKSEMNAKRESTKLLSRIDALTDAFLQETEAQRRSTKLAAAADQSMEGGRGMDWGAWGTIRGVTVGLSSSSLLGSVDEAQKTTKSSSSSSNSAEAPAQNDNRIVVLADTGSDDYAKKLLPDMMESLEKALPGLAFDVYKPTATMPIGADNAACVVIFCTSWTDKSALYAALDRLLRKTLRSDGALGAPPTQLVAVSSIGTERTDKMPYTMQNLMGGGKLDKRRQIEEAVINTVKNRMVEPAMDYTLCKFGELKTPKESFAFAPGDALDGATDPASAVTILTQAIAFQPAARNATLSMVGALPKSDSALELDALLDDSFVKLDGPEIYREDLAETEVSANYASLVEYLREWADLLAETGKGLTTPIRALAVTDPVAKAGVQLSQGVQLLFLPTNTGKNYLSRDEEKQRETNSGKSSTASSPRKKQAKEGGVQVMVEITRENRLRVRAKRCNYVDDAVIKEISEETILKRLQDGISVWEKEHKSN